MVHRINSKYFERKDPVKTFRILILGLLAFCIDGVPFSAGTGGSGGSPPAELLPDQQFTEVVLGILRGEDILIRVDGIDKKYETTAIDTLNGTITVTSPAEGDSILLQNFDKKFSRRLNIRDTFKSIQSPLRPKLPNLSIPENPDVTMVPTEDSLEVETPE